MNNTFKNGNRTELLITSDLTKKIQFNPKYTEEIYQFLELPENNHSLKRIVLLHSVRGVGNEEPEFITKYIQEQEGRGNSIYIPKKFNFQEDTTGGIAICNTMRYVIQISDEVAIGYNPDSEGTKFDYGMVIYNEKPVTVLNPELQIVDPIYNWMKNKRSNEKEFEEFIYDEVWISIMVDKKIPLELKYAARPNKDGKEQPPALAPFSAVQLGMVYASQRPFAIINKDEVKAQSDLEDKLGYFKSYSKVALKLHEIYNK